MSPRISGGSEDGSRVCTDKGDKEKPQKNGGVSSRVGPLTFTILQEDRIDPELRAMTSEEYQIFINKEYLKTAARILSDALRAYGFKIPEEWKNVNR